APPGEGYDPEAALPTGFEIPPEIEAEVAKLGRVLGVFGSNTGRKGLLWAITIFGGVVGLLLLVGFLIVGFRIGCAGLVVGVLAVLLLGVAGQTGYQLARTWGLRVIAFQEGILRIQPGRATVVRWDNISSVILMIWTQWSKFRSGSPAGIRTKH